MGGALRTDVFPPPLLPVAAHHGVVACRSQLAVELLAELHRCTSGLHPTQLARIVQQATENKAPLENEALLESLFDISHLVGGWAGGRPGGPPLPGPHACPQYPLRVHQCPDAPLLTCWFALLPVRSTMASCCVRFLAASACWRRASASRTCRLVLPRFHPLLACFVVSTLLRVCSDVDAALLLAAGGGCPGLHSRSRHAPGGAEDVSGLAAVCRCTACALLLPA